MNNKTYVVYSHTSPSNKKYIGITRQIPTKRWANGNGYKNNKYFSKAIEKYGWNNIKHEILFEGLSHDEACNKEIELIARYNTTNKDYGYNITKGGEGSLGCSKMYEAFGKVQTLREWSEEYNKDYADLCERVNKKGMSLEYALNIERKYILVRYNNEEHSLVEWANIVNIPYDTLFRRYKRGDRDKKLFRPITKETIMIKYNNVEHTLSEWADILNMTRNQLYKRYRKGLRGDALFA